MPGRPDRGLGWPGTVPGGGKDRRGRRNGFHSRDPSPGGTQPVRAGSAFKLLIYLSDGMGRFPEHKPEFDVAFALVDCGCFKPELPEWVIPLYLTGDEAARGIQPERIAAGGKPDYTPGNCGVLNQTEGGIIGGFFGID